MGDNSVAVGPESGRRPTSGLSGNVSNADDLDDDEKHYLSSWWVFKLNNRVGGIGSGNQLLHWYLACINSVSIIQKRTEQTTQF